MGDGAFKTATNLISASLTNVATRVSWRRSNSAFHADFRRFIDGLLAEARVTPFDLALDEWNAEVAAGLAGGAGAPFAPIESGRRSRFLF